MDTTQRIEGNNEPDPLGDDTWTGCESVIRAFEEAWRKGSQPTIEDYVKGDESRFADLLRELVHADLEFRIKAGLTTSVEMYLERFPNLSSDPDTVLDLIAAEFELRRRSERSLSADDYGRRFPSLRSRLPARLLRTHDTIYVAPDEPSDSSADPLDVPGYQIIGEIGRGGMGVVYRALETRLGRHVALKFVPPELAGDPQLLQRFIREAKTASSLNHPHICTVHALGQHRDCPFIVLEFIEGQTLKSLAARRLSITELSRLMRQAASALTAAHAAGVVHRDIKPENIMVRPDGYVKVLDFGLARRLPTLMPSADHGSQDTWPGAMLGTVAFMSPEQARGESLDGSSDIFSFGIVLYLLVSGRHPFERGTPFETLNAITNSQPPRLAHLNPSIPTALEGLIEGMLQKDARLRPSAAEVERALVSIARSGKVVRDAARRGIVHREEELAKLRQSLAAAETGQGSIVCVAGEPGIGKTTLVEDFLDEVALRGTCQLARGRCSERQAAASAYLPIIDALADLLRGETGGTVARFMRVVAPSWSAQLALADGGEPNSAAGSSAKHGATADAFAAEKSQRLLDTPKSPTLSSPIAFSQQALLRELASLLVEVSRLGTVVLFIDDVHWADISTVDLLAYVGRQCHTLPVMMIVTYRPTELLLGPHPFHRVKLELQGQGVCRELQIGFLGRSQIENYLALTFPGHAFPTDFANLVHSRTEGSPLFMSDLLRYLREQGIIAESEGRWMLARELPDIWNDLPESVRSMIQRKLERLDEGDQRLLSVAAAQGHQFDSAVVAEAAQRDPSDVEERLQILDRVHGLVRQMREDEFPDRTPTLRYSFVHVLYQQALYNSLLPTRRRAVSKALAFAWQSHLGDEPSAFAAELGCLFEAGRESAQAARQFHRAAQHAARVFAHRDAVAFARRGIELLETVPESPDRDALELQLQTLLGLQLQVTEGYAARSAELAYERAHELCASSKQASFPVLWGLWLVRKVKNELPRAQKVAQELFDLARSLQAPDLGLQAHQALGLTALCRGEPVESMRHVEQVAALYDPDRHRPHAFLFGQDPGVICKAYGAVALWFLGFPDSAQHQSNQAIAMSRGLSPTSQAVAQHFAAMVFQLCRNEKRARECASASAHISSEHGFRFWLAGGTIIGGWALAAAGDTDAGVTHLQQGLEDWRATSSVTYMTYYLCLLADSLAAQGDADAARQVIDESLALAERTDERMVESELYRMRGVMRLQSPDEHSASLAEADFRRSWEIAQQQEAKSFALRAAINLAFLQSQLGQGRDGRENLERIYNSFTEGFESPDLKDARALLAK